MTPLRKMQAEHCSLLGLVNANRVHDRTSHLTHTAMLVHGVRHAG